MTKETLLKIKDMYESGLNSSEISNTLGIPKSSIIKSLNSLGVKMKTKLGRKRAYKLDEEYFSEINCQNKSYILGFLHADGCVTHQGLHLYIDKKDQEVIDFFLKELSFGTKNPRTARTLIGQSIYSVKMIQDLIKLGITPKKSLSIGFPSLEHVSYKMLKHFIRGVFDGDGSAVEKKNGGFARFCGSKNFIFGLRSFLSKVGIQSSIFDSKKNCFYLTVAQKDSVIRLYYLMYADSNFSLSRKKNKFKKIIENEHFIRFNKGERMLDPWTDNFSDFYATNFENIQIPSHPVDP